MSTSNPRQVQELSLDETHICKLLSFNTHRWTQKKDTESENIQICISLQTYIVKLLTCYNKLLAQSNKIYSLNLKSLATNMKKMKLTLFIYHCYIIFLIRDRKIKYINVQSEK